MSDNERLKKMLLQDISWLSDEGFYTMANRMARVLDYIKQLESYNE